MHICPVAGCRVLVRDSTRLLCLAHWRAVPRSIGRELTDAWRCLRRDGAAGLARYRLARQAAIDAAAPRAPSP